jgi:1,4-dihydroxy-6-naphthoate synthase
MFTLGISPCPNDTFIFFALLNGRIDLGGLCFQPRIEDVETLNTLALEHSLDITKVSCHVYHHISDHYIFLGPGGAFGRGCGPLIIARNPFTIRELAAKKIAIPGKMTTAYLLLKLFFEAEFGSQSFETVPMIFHEIPAAVKQGRVDAGLIIHESRFTYQELGLSRVVDLGEWWETTTGLPIPLGGIVARKSLGPSIQTMQDLIRESIIYSMTDRQQAMPFIRKYARELSDTVINSHINLYVNDYSLDMGDEGRAALAELLRRAKHIG